jgi:hypothetical protein
MQAITARSRSASLKAKRIVMKKISGYVLLNETNSGIPNLMVTAYDSEKSIREIMGDRTNMEGLSLRDLGKRIGSVLTDPDGGFTLDGEDLEFQGNESRPDLLIIIFAPEDVQDLNAPYPLPPEERILYISTVPREDAGAEEAFVIRLLREQLDHFHLTTNTPTNKNIIDDHRLATAIEDAWSFEDRLRDQLKPRLLEEQKKSQEIQSKAQQKVKNLSAIPKYVKNHGFVNEMLLINGKRDLADHLKPKQDKVLANGLERMEARNTVIHLQLTENELGDLGLNVADGKIVGNIDPKKLTEKVKAKINGLDLVRKRGMNNPSPEDLIKKYFLENHSTPASGAQPDSDKG